MKLGCQWYLWAIESCAQGWQSRVRILRDKRLQEAKRHEDMLNKLEGRIAYGRIILLNSKFRRMSPKKRKTDKEKRSMEQLKDI